MRKNNNTNKFSMFAIVALFLVPMLVAGLLFFFHSHFNLSTTNHGVLISPPKKIPVSGSYWSVVYAPGSICKKECLKVEYNLKQMKKALGYSSKRVKVRRVMHLKNMSAGRIYLVDPRGYAFMYYAQTVNPVDILLDLKKVLKISQIG